MSYPWSLEKSTSVLARQKTKASANAPIEGGSPFKLAGGYPSRSGHGEPFQSSQTSVSLNKGDIKSPRGSKGAVITLNKGN